MNTTNTKAGWWLYFMVIALNLLASPILEPRNFESWTSLLIGGIALVGLYGYLRGTAIAAKWFWALYFFACSLICVFYLAKNLVMPPPEGRGLVLSGIIFGIVVSLPLLLSLWRYAFRSPDIWRSDTTS